MNSVYKGAVGEYMVENILARYSNSGIRYIHDMLLPSDSGIVSQIDFLVFTRSKFLVLEVKNWNCIAYITPDSRPWRLVYPNRVITESNPVSQNRKHLQLIQEYTDKTYMNKVLFTPKTQIVGNSPYVISTIDLIMYLNDPNEIYTEEDIENEYNKMMDLKYTYYEDWQRRASNFKTIDSLESLANDLKIF